MAKYNRIKGGEKNERSGLSFSKAELLEVYDLYIEIGGKGIHERNPKIHALAKLQDRTVRSVENQLLGFRLVDTGNTGRANYNKLIKEIWDERISEVKEKEALLAKLREERRKKRLDNDEFKFRISSNLKDIIGKELITDDYVAIFELVKNSFDAHARLVKIIFEDDKITIWDNGKGMDKQEILDRWLFLAYSAKKEGVEDAEFEPSKNHSYRDRIFPKKNFAGAKGIGRFSTDRLGEKLVLTTKKITEDSKFWRLKFNWNDFEKDAEEEFVDIEIEHEKFTASPILGFSQGVVLEISGLRSVWTRSKMLSLKSSLEKLINPFAKTDKEDGNKSFGIEIICPAEDGSDTKIKKKNKEKGTTNLNHRDIVNGFVGNFIFRTLNIKTTSIKIVLSDEKMVTNLNDRGQVIYEIEEPNPYNYIPEGSSIELFYLNQSAKKNFTQLMGITPKDFGSIFLFNNGFRVFPVGEPDDDPFRIDVRKAQGYARHLGTRELIGSIEIWGRSEHFIEASSRDGGLIESVGTYQLESLVEDCVKRLERFVQPILWQIKKRTGSEDEEVDFDAKAEIVDLVAKLAGNKDIEIRDYAKDFLNILNEKTEGTTPQVFENLKKIADKTGDLTFKNEIDLSELEFIKLRQERDGEERKRREAEEREKEERERREIAEQKAHEEVEKRLLEEYKRLKAEEGERKEAEKRRIAENEVLKKEKDRAEAELAKLKAEKKAREEREHREKADQARAIAENEIERRKEQLTRYKAAETINYDDLRDSNHIIGVYSDDISKKILLLKRKIDRGSKLEEKELLSFIQGISLANGKIATICRFTTKSNFLKASLETNEDIVAYIVNYIEKTYRILYKIDVEFINPDISFMKRFHPIELSVVIDNILSNSRKKHAKKVIFNFVIAKDALNISIKDVGDPLSKIIANPDLIFEEGITTTNGAGLGLNHVKRIVEEDLGGSVLYNPKYVNGFELIITIKQ